MRLQARSVLIPADDIDKAIVFLREQLGFALIFRDESRYASLALADFKVDLLGGSERIIDAAALGFRAENLDATIAELTGAGTTLLGPIEGGPHERRAVLRGPSGILLVVSTRT